MTTAAARWSQWLDEQRQRISDTAPLRAEGKLKRVVGLTLEAVGCQAPIGQYCHVETVDNDWLETEVVGFNGDRILLMPTGDMRGVMPDARVIPLSHQAGVPVGESLLGRVIDAAGRPLDGKGPLNPAEVRPLYGPPINPLARDPIRVPLDVGIRSINSMLSVGRGQRIGLFAGSGVGKSVLLGMMTRHTEAEVVVVALIGERGREVKEFVDHILGPDGLTRAVVVATPADQSPLMRFRASWVSTTIAEYFRDQGKNVLLLMDSLTRFAQAQREIALAVGEPPATKGYPPSVFARLPALVERAGNGDVGGGSITAFYTVLAEGDDQQDPIVDSARAILDGHIVLTRKLAESGHYPAIDIEHSVSRVMNDIVMPDHKLKARRFKQIWSTYEQNKDLIAIGAYQAGSDARIDEAIRLREGMAKFLQQDVFEAVSFARSINELGRLMGEEPTA